MFTGIVQTQAVVISAITKNNSLKLKISLHQQFIKDLKLGASVAVNGVCLTVAKFGNLNGEKSFIDFDVIDETLRITNLVSLVQQDTVNIERSLKIGDELGGHIVSGHIHYQASVENIIATAENREIEFQCQVQWMKYIFPKGFITINGTSLTVGNVSENKFSVHLIPETLKITNLGLLKISDKVNIELDQQTVTIVNTIERMTLSKVLTKAI